MVGIITGFLIIYTSVSCGLVFFCQSDALEELEFNLRTGDVSTS